MQKTESNYTMPAMRIEKKMNHLKLKPTKQATVVKRKCQREKFELTKEEKSV